MKNFLLALIVALAGLSTAQAQSIDYVLWDANQLPPYQQCAADFTAQTGIQVNIEQLGWGDYWSFIQTGFVSGEAPDVFTNHLAKYPEFAALGQLVDIEPLAERDGVSTDIYYEGLAELWARDGARYGLPKDWDTIAIVYNADALEAAGVTVEELNTATWNPDDGGTFEQIIARLTIDANGNNGLSPDFDKDNVVQYGFLTDFGGAGAYGQTQWSWLTHTLGWAFNNGIWGDEYYYDDPRFTATIQWMADLMLEKGFMPRLEDLSSLGASALFQAGTAALVSDGSWMIGTYLGSEFEVGFARLPIGPEGRRSMFNGLADSIWVGTDDLESSWAWVQYLGSEACQSVVGRSGVVFPAIPSAADLSLQMRAETDVDVSAFTEQAAAENGTFLFPITDFAAEINTIMSEAIQAVGLGQATAEEAFTEANEEINDLF